MTHFASTEGINGRLPNQDLHNSFRVISEWTGGVPVVLYDHLDPRDNLWREAELSIIPTWVPKSIKELPFIKEYAYLAKNIMRHVGYQARGRASGVHGLLHRFVIAHVQKVASSFMQLAGSALMPSQSMLYLPQDHMGSMLLVGT